MSRTSAPIILVGLLLSSLALGQTIVNLSNGRALPSTVYNPGFPNRTSTTFGRTAWNNTTKVLTLNASGLWYVYETGAKKCQFNGSATAKISSPAAGIWWAYVKNCKFQFATSLPDGFDSTMAAIVYLDASNNGILVTDERHGTSMSSATHSFLHNTVGARYQSGLTITRIAAGTGAADGDAQVYLTGGTIWDEDNNFTIVRAASPANEYEQEIGTAVIPGKLPVLYRSGTGSDNWVIDTATNFPLKTAGTGRAGFNFLNGSTWQVAEATSTNYVVMYVVATNNITEPIIAIMGQSNDTAINTATARTFGDLSLGNLPLPEVKALYKLIFRTSSSYVNSVKSYVASTTDLRNVASMPATNFVATSHSSLTGTDLAGSHPAAAVSADVTNFGRNLSASDTETQAALDTLDNALIPLAGSAGSKPACDATHRSWIYCTQAAASASDNCDICLKDSSENYAWKIFAIP